MNQLPYVEQDTHAHIWALETAGLDDDLDSVDSHVATVSPAQAREQQLLAATVELNSFEMLIIQCALGDMQQNGGFTMGDDAQQPANQAALEALKDRISDIYWSLFPDDEDECEGHPSGPFDPMGTTVYCDGSCRTGTKR